MLTYNKDIKCGLCGDKGHPTSDCRLNIKEENPDAYKLKEFKDVTQTVLVKGLNEADKLKYQLDKKDQPIPTEEINDSTQISNNQTDYSNISNPTNSIPFEAKNAVNSPVNSNSINTNLNDQYDTNTNNISSMDSMKMTPPPQAQIINGQIPYPNMIPGMFNNQFMFINPMMQQKMMPTYMNMSLGKPMQINPVGMKNHQFPYLHQQYLNGQKQHNNPYMSMYGNSNINLKFNQRPGYFGPNTPVFIPSSNYFDDDDEQNKKDEESQNQ